MGMGAVALTALLGESGSLNAATVGTTTNPMAPRQPPLPARAFATPNETWLGFNRWTRALIS